MVKQYVILQVKTTRSLGWTIWCAANQSADILSLIRGCLWQALVHCTLLGHCSLPTTRLRVYLLCHMPHRELVQSPKIMYSSGLPQATDNVGHKTPHNVATEYQFIMSPIVAEVILQSGERTPKLYVNRRCQKLFTMYLSCFVQQHSPGLISYQQNY